MLELGDRPLSIDDVVAVGRLGQRVQLHESVRGRLTAGQAVLRKIVTVLKHQRSLLSSS